MISLKKYLDMEIKELPAAAADPGELFPVTLEAYRAALRSMGEGGARACPSVGSDLQHSLGALADRLESEVTVALLIEIGSQASERLQQWGNQTAQYFEAKTVEVKELLITLAHTAEAVGQRDTQYTANLNQFTTRLRAIGNLEDLSQVRASLMKQAVELKTYVDQMQEDSHKLVGKLQTEVSTYEARLKKTEELALRDALTGLANRHRVEERIAERITYGRDFCIVMLDLNRLKNINDKHGHLAGDSVLQQFAQELRSSSRSSDLVGRWGGDEFLIVMDGDDDAANVQIERLRNWTFGDYSIRPGKGSDAVKVVVDAAVGMAPWQPGETLKMVVERADAEMYRQKNEMAKKPRA